MPEVTKTTLRRELRQIPVGWPKTLLLVSLFLVLMSLAISLLLEAYRGSLSNTSASIDTDITNVIADLPQAEVGKLLTLDSQIQNLRQLLPKHIAASRLFEELEENTHPQVRWENFALDMPQNKLRLEGSSPSFMVPSLQAAALSRISFARSATLERASIGEQTGDVKFKITILLQPNSLLFAP